MTLCICSGSIANFLDFFGIWVFESDTLLTQVPRPMFVDYFSPFAPWCYSVILDYGSLLTVGNDGFECSVGENTILSEIGDASATESSDVPTLDSGSSSDKSVTSSNFVVSVDNDG